MQPAILVATESCAARAPAYDDAMSRERLLVARAAEIQFQTAANLIRQAMGNLAALRHGIAPAYEAAKKAHAECEKAHLLTQETIKRIPE